MAAPTWFGRAPLHAAAISGCVLPFVRYEVMARKRRTNELDEILREAYAEFADPEFTEVTGLSGSPTFDATLNRLAGMVVRGALADRA
jgi:hypothetical protein